MDGENPAALLLLDKARLTNGDEGLVASLSIMELDRRRADTLMSTNGVTIMLRKQDTAYDTSSFDARGWSERQGIP
jgi:predicted RNA polymerase sigma factor